MVEVDPLESDLVLYNLFKNSLEACKNESAPLISITVEESEQEAVIQIRDNGPEISEDLVNSIFIPKVSQKRTAWDWVFRSARLWQNRRELFERHKKRRRSLSHEALSA